MITWILVALGSTAIAMLLAAADGALLASAYDARDVTPDPERTHRALALGRVLAHLLTGAAIALGIAQAPLIPSAGLLVSIALLLVNVALVERIARGAGYGRAALMRNRLAPVVAIADAVMLPVTWLGGAVERGLGRLLPPLDDRVTQRETGAEQFREVVAAEADVSAAEEEILHGVFALGDTNVEEIMVPRVDVIGIEKGTPWSETIDRIRSSGHARYPVFEDTLDNIIGILYAKDLLRPFVSGDEPGDWSTLVRPASFIPATKRIDQQLRDFKAQRTHIAVVVDEFGGTAGIVTIEDVLEEIVGEIRDEYDVEDPPVVQEGSSRFWVSGRLSLTDLGEVVNHDFRREDLTTVAGLVYDAFGRVPRAGESTIVDGFKVVVERVRRRRIERVFMERLQQATADDEEAEE